MKKVYSGSFEGIHAKTVSVETSFSKGLPSFSIVGLGNASIQESKERIKSSLSANNYTFPPMRVTINLSPSDLKKEGKTIYLVGKQTEEEMGGSEYYKTMGVEGGDVPKTDTGILSKCMKGILSAIGKEYIASCHDVSEGGIGVCLSEMIIGGDIGTVVDLSNVSKKLRSDFKLFSESNTRWVLEVKKQSEKDFGEALKKEDVPFIKIGKTKGKKLIINKGENALINLDINTIRNIWKNTIRDIMG